MRCPHPRLTSGWRWPRNSRLWPRCAIRYQLRPSALEHGGLRSALERRLEAVERRAGIDVTLIASDAAAELLGPIADALYRIAQDSQHHS